MRDVLQLVGAELSRGIRMGLTPDFECEREIVMSRADHEFSVLSIP